MKIGFALTAKVISQVSAVLLRIRSALIDACLGLKRLLCQSLKELLLLVRKSVKVLKERLSSLIQRLRR